MGFKCCECEKDFTMLYSLKKHAIKFHPDKVDLVAPKKIYKYQCENCNKNFDSLNNFNRHKNTHKTAEISVNKLQCPLCNLNASRANLLKHFSVDHDIKIKTSTFKFNSFEELITWKNQIEKSTKSRFVKERGTVFKKNEEIVMYYCHRSGTYNSKSKGLRQLKKQGSNKINSYCPAFMKVIKNENECKVFFADKHIGHENDLGHLYLTSKERETLANKMALKIPLPDILNEIRDSVDDSQLERIHLLTKKDLHNIGNSFNLKSIVVRHENDVVCVDASEVQSSGCEDSIEHVELEDHAAQLAKEKEKLKANLNKIIDNIVSIEQIEAFKKLCASIEPTLTEIGNKLPEMKLLVPSRRAFKRKNSPQRNKLYATKIKKNTTSKRFAKRRTQEKQEIVLRASLG